MSQATQGFPDGYSGEPPPPRRKNLGRTALILGIAGFLTGLLPFVGLALGILAVVLSINALKMIREQHGEGRSSALAGIILGGIAALTGLIVTIALVFGVATGAAGGSSANDEPAAAETPQAAPELSETSMEPAPAPEPDPEAEAAAEAERVRAEQEAAAAAEAERVRAEEEAAAAEAARGSVSQQQARGSAENYLEYAAFSRTGLIKQLEFEGFSTEDATWGVDNVEVDYNEQAAKSAENYLELTNFSRSGLIDQLVFEGFTPEQAEYGVSQTGL